MRIREGIGQERFPDVYSSHLFFEITGNSVSSPLFLVFLVWVGVMVTSRSVAWAEKPPMIDLGYPDNDVQSSIKEPYLWQVEIPQDF